VNNPLLSKNWAALLLGGCCILTSCAANLPSTDSASAVAADDTATELPAEPPQLPAATETTVAPSAAPAPSYAQTFSSPEQAALYQAALYKAMTAELAGFRNDYVNAATYYMEAAKLMADPRLAARATRVAFYAKNSAVAQSAAQLWQRLAPNDPEARQTLIAVLLRAGDTVAATHEISALLDHGDSLSEQQADMLIELLKQGGDQEAALTVLDNLATNRPQDARLRYLQARLLIGAEQNDRALAALRQLLVLEPEHASAVPLYAQLLQEQDKLPDALSFLEQQLRSYPKQDEWRLLYARLLITAERTSDAQAQFKTLLEHSPKDMDLLYALSLLHLQGQQTEQAQQTLERMLSLATLEEQRNTARYFLGQTAEQAKQSETALSWYRQVGKGTHYFNAQTRLILLLLDQKAYTEAKAQLARITTSDNEEALNLLKLEAEIYLHQKAYQAARDVYQRGLDGDPENTDLLYMRAMMEEKLQRVDLSEKYFRRVLEIEPDNVETLNALGYTLADKTTRFDEAYQLIRKAYDARPNAYYILDSMGWVLYRLGRHEEAVDYLQRALTAKHDPEIAAHLGEVLWHSARQREAQQIWEKAAKDFPDDELLRDTMQRLLSKGQ